MEYTVLPDPGSVAKHAADLVESEIGSSRDTLLGLAGGSTPKATYRELAGRTIDWSHTTAWMTDERWVPPNDDDSNQKMARASFVDPTGVAFLAPDTTMDSIDESAVAFSKVIVGAVESCARSVVLLGIGTDGHTASLFPGTPALDVSGARYVANFVETLGVWRMTATFGLLATADLVVFLVTGASKAPTIASIAGGADMPSGRVTARGRVLWILDEAAAAGL